MLQGYWQAEMAPAMKAAVMADWADELEDWSVAQVRWGLRQWRRENPSRRPNPGHIRAILIEERGREVAARARAAVAALPAQEAVTQTPEERAASAARVAEITRSFTATANARLASDDAAEAARRREVFAGVVRRFSDGVPAAEEGAA